MKKLLIGRVLAVLIALAMAMPLFGCSSNAQTTNSDIEPSPANMGTDVPPEETMVPVSSEGPNEAYSAQDIVSSEAVLPSSAFTTPEETVDIPELTERQRNSFSMLYYLAITAEEIRISKDNRLILDDIYTSLLNDINPGAIDETTQEHLQNLRDIIKSYINISVKRDRLQYIYNQDKATTIRSAVPNPLAVLSVANSFDWKRLATSVVYTVVDSYNKYKSANEAADRAFLLSGWELDDEETAAIQKNRERAFDYMVDIVQEYGLDGKLTLNEKAIENFAEISEIDSVHEKIHRLEAEEETYKLLGNYWLELADCYFETSQYAKCLECVDRYNDLATGIYRKDYNYVQILPKAIVAVQETYDGDEYISRSKGYADAIIENTTTEEWSIRYFAAQVYLDLYAKTNDQKYLQAAYDIAYDNVTILLDEQRALNATYLDDVKELEIAEPDYRFMTSKEKKEAEKQYKDEKDRLKAYNKELKEVRKTELPSLYEPLVLNCDLLIALAEELHISETEKSEIEAILQTDENGIFLVDPINDRYSFSAPENSYSIDLSRDEILVPVNLLSSGADISVAVTGDGKSETFDDCTITKVDREGTTVDSFYAHVSSKQMKGYEWTDDSRVTVSITNADEDNAHVFNFIVDEHQDRWIFTDKVVFKQE